LPGSLRGRRLVLARAGWILVALVSVVGFAASVPAHYARALRYSGRNLHAPEAMKVGLERLGIPFEAYVFYWTAVLVLLAVVFFLVGAVIFWRRSDDPAALFEILALLAAGKNNAEIAGTLFLSLKTVRNYVSNIFAKLRVTDRAQAIVRARGAGLGRDDGGT
jgi:DNA-binding CsgD family transcriptional regulator